VLGVSTEGKKSYNYSQATGEVAAKEENSVNLIGGAFAGKGTNRKKGSAGNKSLLMNYLNVSQTRFLRRWG